MIISFLSIRSHSHFSSKRESLLFLCGIVMACSEIWKQFTLTYTLGAGAYDWWYFPFQLCSIPMYLLLAFPWIKNDRIRCVILVFLMTYTLTGGLAVFADTSGLRYPLTSLTVHSYLWHILLILLGLYAGRTCLHLLRNTNTALRAFAGSTGLYLICCFIAEILNLSLDRYGTINMFYINPDYPMQQIVFREISLSIGNIPGILLYIVFTVLGAFLLLLLWLALFRICRHLRSNL